MASDQIKKKTGPTGPVNIRAHSCLMSFPPHHAHQIPDNVMRKNSRTSDYFAGPVDPWSYCSSNFLSLASRPVSMVHFYMILLSNIDTSISIYFGIEIYGKLNITFE